MSAPAGDAGLSGQVTKPQAVTKTQDQTPKQLPKGVVLGKDGKPCRSCTSFASWAAMNKAQPSGQGQTAQFGTATEQGPASASPALTLPPDCPADVEQLGHSTWTFLHTLTATYPSRPTPAEQQQTRSFISLFSNMYPCSHCAEDLRDWMKQAGNEPRVESRDEFGRWMCEAHNAVNEKLGKATFDCNKWAERWRTGPPDGSVGPMWARGSKTLMTWLALDAQMIAGIGALNLGHRGENPGAGTTHAVVPAAKLRGSSEGWQVVLTMKQMQQSEQCDWRASLGCFKDELDQ